MKLYNMKHQDRNRIVIANSKYQIKSYYGVSKDHVTKNCTIISEKESCCLKAIEDNIVDINLTDTEVQQKKNNLWATVNYMTGEFLTDYVGSSKNEVVKKIMLNAYHSGFRGGIACRLRQMKCQIIEIDFKYKIEKPVYEPVEIDE
jgi:predicted transcriptional regulator